MPRADSDTRTTPTARAASRRLQLGRLRRADLYDAWLFAEADATLALGAWRSAARADKPDAHAAYLAALDREACAAEILQKRLRPTR